MNTHKKINELLIGFVLGELSNQQESEVKAHLAECQKCSNELKRLEVLLNCAGQMSQLSADKQLCESAKKAILETVETERMKPTPRPSIDLVHIWRTIMKARITKLATAAMIFFIAFAVWMYLFGGSGDLFANMLEKIEHIDSFTYQHKMTIKGIVNNLPKDIPITLDSTVYVSDKHGIRQDMQMGSSTISIIYIPPDSNVITQVLPMSKNYIYATMTNEQIQEKLQKVNPKGMIKEFKSFAHKNLDIKTIDGFEAEGIEVDDPNFMAETFETAVGRLWVDVESQLPVRIEIEGSSADGQAETKIIAYDFDWISLVEPEIFEINIPPDYTLHGEIDISNNETAAVNGLRLFAEITDGQYPSNLDIFTTKKEATEALLTDLLQKPDANINPNMPFTKEQLEKMSNIIAACSFYAKLLKEKKEPVYFGEKVTAENENMPLLIWKVSDSEFRIIFGNLSAENVSVERLSELENDPNFIAVMEAPRKRATTTIAETFLGHQQDKWHLTAGDKIIAHSSITLTAWPEEPQPMQIALPYPNAALQSVKLGDLVLAFKMLDKGNYEIEIPYAELEHGQKDMEFVWTVSLSELQKVDYGYRTVLKSLLNVSSYKLYFVLEPDCNYTNSKDSTLTQWRMFAWNSPENPNNLFGSCGITIQKLQ